MALTLSSIRQYIQDRSNENTSTKGQRIQNRIANQALAALHSAGDWDFDRGLVRVVSRPQRARAMCRWVQGSVR